MSITPRYIYASDPSRATAEAASAAANEINYAFGNLLPQGMSETARHSAALAEIMAGRAGGIAPALDIRSFGNWQNGVDCTATWLAAVAAVNANAASGLGSTALGLPSITPPGVSGPIVQRNGYQVIGANIIPANVTGCATFANGTSLIGSGAGSVISLGTANQQTNVQYYFGFFHSSNFTMSYVTVDGNKSNFVNTTGQANVQFFDVFPTTTNIAHCVFDHCITHDTPAAGISESFGFCTWSGSTDFTFNQCLGYNCVGTPLHVLGGATVLTTQCSDIRVLGGAYYNNTFQGISDYNSTNIQYVGVKAYGNLLAGLNSEYSVNVQMMDNVTYNNGHYGIAVLGACQNIYISGGYTTNNTLGEIAVTTSGFVNGAQLVAQAQGPVEIHNVKAFPASGKPHLTVQARTAPTGTSAGPYFSSLGANGTGTDDLLKGPVTIDTPDAANWVVWDAVAGNATTMATGLRIPVKTGARPVLVGKLNDNTKWTAVAPLTQIANSLGATLGTNSVGLSNTNASAGSYASGFVLLQQKAFLLRWRCNAADTNATWQIQVKEQTSNTILYSQLLTNQVANDRGNWYENAYVVKTGTTNPAQIIISPTGTPSATSLSRWDCPPSGGNHSRGTDH